MKTFLYTISIIILVGAAAWLAPYLYYSSQGHNSNVAQDAELSYQPTITPSNFTTTIDNPFFSLTPGKKFTYEGQSGNGVERVEITIESGTKTVAGVETLIYHDRVFVDNVLVEDTKDYLAQQISTGDVWYFGEEVDNYENGIIVDHQGTFLAGVDGAQPGIWIKKSQRVGDSYRQEYYRGEAEDMRDVLAVDQTVTIELATYTGCVKVYDWTPLDPESKETKYHCPGVAAEVKTEEASGGIELIKVE